MTRRDFLRTATQAALAGGALASASLSAAERRPEARFFTVARRNGRWWFITPAGESFFALALNHIDPAPLRYPENGDLWQRKYGNSMERWLKEAVRPDLLDWGFNSVGWVQEVVTRGPTNHRHSRSFTFEEYQWLDLPYCHLLPFADFHQWEMETRHPDFFSQEFADWCDYVAREHCARMAGDPKLIGYFYIDCPTWVHTRPGNEWKGPLFDPEKLKTATGKTELGKLATRYYQVTHDAIRRYDKNHLILGDRYEARAPLPEEVVRAALPFVDALSFQDFGPVAKIAENFRKWAAVADKPAILADSAGQLPASAGFSRQDPKKYRDTLAALREIPTCIGFHLCGAYLRNNARKRALRDAQERPDAEALRAIKEANAQTTAWARQAGQSK